MLILNAGIYGAVPADLRIEEGGIAAVGQLSRRPGEKVFDQRGAAVLPGLCDHHIHLMSFAAALDSVACGPPAVHTSKELIDALGHGRPTARGWIRGIGYHESVAGDIDRHWLDEVCPEIPVRVQHRTGRLWIVNSAGLDRLARACSNEGPPNNTLGRFYDQDGALGRLWGRTFPPVGEASRRLAAYGLTGLTDLTVHNDDAAAGRFAELRSAGRLLQRIRVGGVPGMTHDLAGPTKVLLHDADLPDFDAFAGLIASSHDGGREVAVHCVTEGELVFALAGFRSAGSRRGDRIEHASVTPPPLLEQIRDLGLIVVTQPRFIAERGDVYLSDLPHNERPWLYRCRGFLDGGIPLAGGSDAPFGHADPWRAMRAAVHRLTESGHRLGEREELSPEEALSLFLGSLEEPHKPRRIETGAPADLCLLDRPWDEARILLDSGCVRGTVCSGEWIYNREDQDRLPAENAPETTASS